MPSWLTALGAEIVYAGPNPKPEAESELGARRLDLAALLEAADVVSLHAPAIPETRGLIGAAELELIGPDGVLVNTSRGPLVDSEAVAAALEGGTLGAAGLDVYENEPDVPPRLLRGAALRPPPAHRLGDGAGARRDGEGARRQRDRGAGGAGPAEPRGLAPGRASERRLSRRDSFWAAARGRDLMAKPPYDAVEEFP